MPGWQQIHSVNKVSLRVGSVSTGGDNGSGK